MIVGPVTGPLALESCRLINYASRYYLEEGQNVSKSGSVTGIDYLTSGTICATNCLFAGNSVNTAIFRVDGRSKLINCTVADNSAYRTLWEVSETKTMTAENCIFVGNMTGSTPRNLWTTGTNVTLRNCFVGSGRSTAPLLFEENTITNDNPKFVKDGSRDAYALKLKSPAIGKGLVMDWMADALDIRDDEAYPRLRDGAVDIGCYQCWLDPIGFKFSIK